MTVAPEAGEATGMAEAVGAEVAVATGMAEAVGAEVAVATGMAEAVGAVVAVGAGACVEAAAGPQAEISKARPNRVENRIVFCMTNSFG